MAGRQLSLLEFVWSFLDWFLIFAPPLDFHGRVRVVGSMYLPAALQGVEASLLASDSLRKLRSPIIRLPGLVVNLWLMLVLLDGPTGCDPAFCVVWFRFRLLCRYLALWPTEVGLVYRLLEMVSKVAQGMVLSIFFLLVLLQLVFGGILMLLLG